MENTELVGTIAALYIYPIKGCKAINVPTLRTAPRGGGYGSQRSCCIEWSSGFPYDRHWVIVKEATHRFITQRNFEKLAKIIPELPSDVLDGSGPLAARCLSVRLPQTDVSAERFEIPLVRDNPVLRQITVDEWTGAAMDEGDEAANKLTEYLGTSVRLFRFISDIDLRQRLPKDKITRSVDSNYAFGHETTFTDGFPYLIVNQASYEKLRKKVDVDFPINRFRPNIVVKGQNAWEEDEWRQIQTFSPQGGGERSPTFRLVKPCKRCIVSCIDQSTALPGIQPLETLKVVRNGEKTGFVKHLKGAEKQGFFGWNAVCQEEKLISVDDLVCVLKYGTWTPGLSLTEYALYAFQWVCDKTGFSR